MRNRIIGTAAVVVLALTGCSTGEESQETGTATQSSDAGASLEAITVKGDFGKKPEVSFDTPLSITDDAHETVIEGDGETIDDGQQVTADYTLVSGKTGEVVESTYDAGEPSGFPMDTSQISQALYEAVLGATVGSRVVMTTQGSAAQGGETETLVFVWDITSVEEQQEVLEKATGKDVDFPSDLPQITTDDSGAPSISEPEGDAPDELVIATRIEGEGAKVEDGQTVTVQYTGWLWDDTSEPFDSSWTRGEPFSFQVGAGSVIAGWDEGIKGQKVGSQVMLVVPPDKGYGDSDNGSIPANSTLIFVVDILSAVG